MHNVGDQVLFVVSARRKVPWATFKQVFDDLYIRRGDPSEIDLETLPSIRLEAVRSFDGLAHCEFYFGDPARHVYAAPPMLALLPQAGMAEGVLCGSRSPGTSERLAEACQALSPHAEFLYDPPRGDGPIAPARLAARATTVEALEVIATELGVHFSRTPPAWLLANLAPSLREYADSLTWRRSDEPNWARRDFDCETLVFRDAAVGRPRPPVRLTAYRDPVRGTPMHMAWNAEQCATVDRDWGRYWVLHQTGRRVVVYDERRFRLYAPASAPVPPLVARALVLCSGRPPEAASTNAGEDLGGHGAKFTAYSSVPAPIGRVILEKLGQ